MRIDEDIISPDGLFSYLFFSFVKSSVDYEERQSTTAKNIYLYNQRARGDRQREREKKKIEASLEVSCFAREQFLEVFPLFLTTTTAMDGRKLIDRCSSLIQRVKEILAMLWGLAIIFRVIYRKVMDFVYDTLEVQKPIFAQNVDVEGSRFTP